MLLASLAVPSIGNETFCFLVDVLLSRFFVCLLTYNLPRATKGLRWLTTEAETINNAKISIRIRTRTKENVKKMLRDQSEAQ